MVALCQSQAIRGLAAGGARTHLSCCRTPEPQRQGCVRHQAGANRRGQLPVRPRRRRGGHRCEGCVAEAAERVRID
eukprot:SM009427S24664  [mRNA]  locus=s9427:165:490:- [translate_table: standard]